MLGEIGRHIFHSLIRSLPTEQRHHVLRANLNDTTITPAAACPYRPGKLRILSTVAKYLYNTVATGQPDDVVGKHDHAARMIRNLDIYHTPARPGVGGYPFRAMRAILAACFPKGTYAIVKDKAEADRLPSVRALAFVVFENPAARVPAPVYRGLVLDHFVLAVTGEIAHGVTVYRCNGKSYVYDSSGRDASYRADTWETVLAAISDNHKKKHIKRADVQYAVYANPRAL